MKIAIVSNLFIPKTFFYHFHLTVVSLRNIRSDVHKPKCGLSYISRGGRMTLLEHPFEQKL